MDCSRLLDSLDMLGYAGTCVGTENSQILQNSLLVLQQENHFKKCYYWGKMYGVRSDYHIAYGFEKDCMNGQVYYYSMNGLNWLLLPKTNKCARFLTPLAVNKFEGDPSIVTNVYNINRPFPSNEDTKKYYDGPIPKELKEEDRLAAVVELIREDAAVIPRGAWFKCPNGDVIENLGFEGLPNVDASYLKSYLHARPPQQKWNTNLLTRPDYNYSLDFLDTIDLDVPQGVLQWEVLQHPPYSLDFAPSDFHLFRSLQNSLNGRNLNFKEAIETCLANFFHEKPKSFFKAGIDKLVDHWKIIVEKNGCWSLQFVRGDAMVILHSLYWPGLTFYHKLNNSDYGFLYFGHGKRNMDVVFMI